MPESLCATLVDMIHGPILAELTRRGAPFRGALYAGLMLTPEGPVLIECNARFGDPEIQALLPRLAVPLGPLLLGAALGDLAGAAAELGLVSRMLPTTGDAAVAIVLAAANYPETPRRGIQSPAWVRRREPVPRSSTPARYAPPTAGTAPTAAVSFRSWALGARSPRREQMPRKRPSR